MGHNFFKLAVYSLNSYQPILDLNLPVISSNSISTNANKEFTISRFAYVLRKTLKKKQT